MASPPSDADDTVTLARDLTGPLGPGSILGGRYQISGELGRGGMGVVFRATDLELLREVALKVVPEASSSAEARERLLREARAAAALNHPRIVSVYDVGVHEGAPFFVMELVTGTSLGSGGPRTLEEIVDIGGQLCEALAHAHEHGLVHRDLKPDNVLLSSSGAGKRMVKLADLGLAIPSSGSRLTLAGMIVGTANYMPPEQALGQAIDGRADLYSLGVVLYELTTGRLPFLGDHPLAVVSQHVNAPVVPPRAFRPDLPRPLEAVILKLLAKDPSGRFASAGETALALRSSLAPESVATGDAVPTIALLDALSRGRLVAREAELAEARGLWERARGGRGHGALLSGEPGAGKTRLARELAIQAALDGAIVLRGGCYEYEATTPYLPFAEAFRRWVRDQEDDTKLRTALGDGAKQLKKLAPEIETRLGPFAKAPELAPHEERLLFFDAIAETMRRLAGTRGLLVHLDDIHWADSSSLWLLGHLLRNLKGDRVLFLGCYRETELDRAHPLSKALVDFNRERLITRISLKRFDVKETRAQLAALLGEDVNAEFSATVYRETDGNPFFVEEVLKELIEQGAIFRGAEKWERCAVTELRIPQSVKQAIGHRLSRMTPECNEVLRAGAVLGKSFEFRELAEADSRGEDALLDALDEAVTAQLLVAGKGDTFSFTHDKIREVLYEELNPVRRRRLHARVAQALEKLGAEKPRTVEILAHHFIEAGDHERGLKYAKEAARLAEQLSAFDEAVHAYEGALECADALGRTEEQLWLEEAIGKAFMAMGEMIAALTHFEKALELAADPVERAKLQCQAASSLVQTGDPRGLAHLTEALAVLDPATHPLETAQALATEARFHHLAGRHRQAVALLERAEALAQNASADQPMSAYQGAILALTYGYLAGAYQHLGLFTEGDRWALKAVEFGTEHGNLHSQANGYEFLAEDATNMWMWVKGLEYAGLEREVVARLHSRERLAWTYLPAGICTGNLGDTERSEREFHEGIALSASLGEKRLACLLRGSLGVLQAEMDQLDEALKTAAANLADADAIGLLHTRADARRCLAHVLWKRGELPGGLRNCEELLEITSTTESRVARLWLGPVHFEILFAMERFDEAASRLDEFAAMVAQCQSPLHVEAIAGFRARLAARPAARRA
ncbi:MAG: AAA family ATPase [Thermoanaerobaculia bacterium]